jgi:hypothetical protein
MKDIISYPISKSDDPAHKRSTSNGDDKGEHKPRVKSSTEQINIEN